MGGGSSVGAPEQLPAMCAGGPPAQTITTALPLLENTVRIGLCVPYLNRGYPCWFQILSGFSLVKNNVSGLGFLELEVQGLRLATLPSPPQCKEHVTIQLGQEESAAAIF